MNKLAEVAKHIAGISDDITELLESHRINELTRAEEREQQQVYDSRYAVGTEVMHVANRTEKLVIVALPKNSPNYIVRKPDGTLRLLAAHSMCASLCLPAGVDPYENESRN